jgi:hypothetical protein
MGSDFALKVGMIPECFVFHLGMGNDFLQTGRIPIAFVVWKLIQKKSPQMFFSFFFCF